MSQQCERTDERMAQYFSLYSWLLWPTVEGRKLSQTQKRKLKPFQQRDSFFVLSFSYRQTKNKAPVDFQQSIWPTRVESAERKSRPKRTKKSTLWLLFVLNAVSFRFFHDGFSLDFILYASRSDGQLEPAQVRAQWGQGSGTGIVGPMVITTFQLHRVTKFNA